jgi:hypothetical protein
MATVPSNLIPVSITQLPVPTTPASEDTLLVGVYQGVTYKIRAGDLLNVAGVPLTRQVIAGTGLTGGGALSSNVTLSVAPGGIGPTQLATSGVTPGVYGSASALPQITVDANGRVTAATSFPFSVTGFVPVTTEVIAGTGLTGGGPLNGNVTLNARLSNATPLSLNGSGSAGSSSEIARTDHRHPSLNLSSDVQVDSILGIGNGGTGRSLVMNPGAIMWSGSDGLYVSAAGTLGQVLVSGGTSAPTWGSTLIVAPVPANSMFAGPVSGGSADPTFRTLVNADLPASGVVANTYGSGALVPVLVVNSKGVVTSASSTAVTPAWANVTGTPTTIAGYGIVDGVTLTGTQILTNKTIDASLNTLSNIPNAALSNSSLAFTYAGGIAGSASVSLGGTNALSLSNVPNASLANSAITINGSSVSLGGSVTVTATASAALTIGTGLSGTSYNGSTAVTIANTGVLSNIAGTAISVSGATGNVTITNTAPDQVVTLTQGGTTTITGTYPNFTISSADQYAGTVTSVGGTGTVSGITLSGTVTTSGNLTLGGTLDLSSPPTIGNTTPNTGRFTTLTVNDNTTLGSSNSDTINFVGRINSDFDPATDNTYDLGRTGHEWRDLYIDGTANIDSLIADTADINAGTIDGTTIGAAVAAAVTGTTITATTQFSGAGTGLTGTASGLSIGGNAATATSATSATTATNLAGGAASQIPYQTGAGATAFIANGTAGQVLTSAGSSVPVWSGISGGTF